MTRAGKVWLVGAGPGDPELLTQKAVRALSGADVVLVDALVDRAAVAHAPSAACIVAVGKRGGCASTPQAFIVQLMIREARAGHRVVRLKGGDPFVFGRGGEERDALVAAGLEVEVVPGVTSGLAAPAAAGIAITQRGRAPGVALVTAHVQEGGREPDWRALAASGLSLAIYMGLTRRAHVAESLLAGGMAPATPVAVIEDGTRATQRVVVTTLAYLGVDAAVVRVTGPAVIVIGEVAADACASDVPRSSAARRTR